MYNLTSVLFPRPLKRTWPMFDPRTVSTPVGHRTRTSLVILTPPPIHKTPPTRLSFVYFMHFQYRNYCLQLYIRTSRSTSNNFTIFDSFTIEFYLVKIQNIYKFVELRIKLFQLFPTLRTSIILTWRRWMMESRLDHTFLLQSILEYIDHPNLKAMDDGEYIVSIICTSKLLLTTVMSTCYYAICIQRVRVL